jgi:Glycosyl transferases group 1
MIVGERGESWTGLAKETRRRAAEVPNLEVASLLPQASLEDLYARAVAVVNTSWFEGFPNTFLEGWSLGTPALSLHVDPDSTIQQNCLGVVCGGSPERLAAEARRLWAQRDEVDSEPLRGYIERVHDPAVIGRRWAAIVRGLLED